MKEKQFYKEHNNNKFKIKLIKKCMFNSFNGFDEIDWQILIQEERGFDKFIEELCKAMEIYKTKTNKYGKNKIATLRTKGN